MHLVCLMKLGDEKPRIRVVTENYVPKRGEEVQIVGRFRSKPNAILFSKQEVVATAWKTMLFVNDETMWDVIPHR